MPEENILANVEIEGQKLDEEGNLVPDLNEPESKPSIEEKETPSDLPKEEKTEEEQP